MRFSRGWAGRSLLAYSRLRSGRLPRRAPFAPPSDVAATFKWPTNALSKRAKPGMTPGLRLVQGPEIGAATSRQPRWWVRVSLWGGGLRGYLRRLFVEPWLRPASRVGRKVAVDGGKRSSI